VTHHIDYRAAFKCLPGAVALLSPDLIILDVSNGYLDAAGCGPDRIVGQNILEAFPENPHDPGLHKRDEVRRRGPGPPG
jgi:PAS domain-containing protein